MKPSDQGDRNNPDFKAALEKLRGYIEDACNYRLPDNCNIPIALDVDPYNALCDFLMFSLGVDHLEDREIKFVKEYSDQCYITDQFYGSNAFFVIFLGSPLVIVNMNRMALWYMDRPDDLPTIVAGCKECVKHAVGHFVDYSRIGEDVFKLHGFALKGNGHCSDLSDAEIDEYFDNENERMANSIMNVDVERLKLFVKIASHYA